MLADKADINAPQHGFNGGAFGAIGAGSSEDEGDDDDEMAPFAVLSQVLGSLGASELMEQISGAFAQLPHL